MKRYISYIIFSLIVLTMQAQPNYKYIIQHLDEMSDYEALYNLSDYQGWYPKKPHAYYLLGNIYYRLFQNEHSIADYQEKQRMIYNASLYYGNCRVFLKNDHIKADMYPLAATNGKISEEQLTAWLTARMDTLSKQKKNIETLYNSYSTLVSRYDTCQVLFESFASRYRRIKGAQLMLDSTDIVTLAELRKRAMMLPDDIKHFQQSLKTSPIANYDPVFSSRPISLYRLDGLTATDFLQNNVVLWDYLSWVDEFNAQQRAVNKLRQELYNEHQSLISATPNEKPENRHLLNTINKYDEHSPMIDFLHLEYLTMLVKQTEQRLQQEMQKEEVDWLIRLQLAYRLTTFNAEADDKRYETLASPDTAQYLRLRYTDFMSALFPDSAESENLNNLSSNLSSYLTNLSDQRTNAWQNVKTMLQHAVTAPVTLQINSKIQATLTNDSLTFTQIQTQE